MNAQFWDNKRVFITGHTGFKGSWMSLYLHHLGANIKGYAKAPETDPNMYELVGLSNKIESQIADINDYETLASSLLAFNPEIIFHLAAQPLVRESYQTPLETYQTNVMGTAHVLEAARHIPSLKAIVIVTTDKCYENKEWVWPYRETEPLGGYDPYSSSKACAEIITAAYRQSFYETNKIGIATARAGNVIGGGDFSNDRLIPDIIRAIQNNTVITLRYPNAIRPWQHVLEPITGYATLAENLYNDPQSFSNAWNFGPHLQDTKTVSQLVDRLIQKMGRGSWQPSSENHLHEAHLLKLDIQKAQAGLNWKPQLNIEKALDLTCDWYNGLECRENLLQLTTQQIQDFLRREHE